MAVEHGYFIADDERGGLEKFMYNISFLDVAVAVLVDGDRNFQLRMSCTTTWQEEGSVTNWDGF
jgi:hypothetical protein